MAKSSFNLVVLMILSLSFFATYGAGFPVTSFMVKVLTTIKAAPEKWHRLQSQVTELASDTNRLTESVKNLEKVSVSAVAVSQSIVFCGHHKCDYGMAYFHPDKDLCVCQLAPKPIMTTMSIEDRHYPNVKCHEHIQCGNPLIAAFNPFTKQCVCSLYLFPDRNGVVNTIREPNKTDPKQRLKEWSRPMKKRHYHSAVASNRLKDIVTATNKLRGIVTRIQVTDEILKRRQSAETSGAIPLPPLPTFVPPPKTDITPALIQQSLVIKPQQNAVVHSIIPHFGAGVISFYAQLDGPVPQSLQLNATDSMPCGAIGMQPDPNLVVVPQNVNEGVKEVVLPDCLIIAVNKINASWINYWVQKVDGSSPIYSLLGDAQIHDIDRLDTSKPAALSIRVSTATVQAKRDLPETHGSMAHLKRQQVFTVDCDHPCTKTGVTDVEGSAGICGCLKDEVEQFTLMSRAVDAPDAYNAIMTAAACAAMTCINNGNKSALFNPFSKTCWCAAPTYVEINESAHIG